MKGTEVWVLDTSAIINGYPQDSPIEKYTVPEVAEEARSISLATSVGVLIDTGDLRLWEASPGSLEKVRERLGEIGGELSDTDSRLVALAIDLAEMGMAPVLLTDDYSLQNLAEVMGLHYRSMATAGIESVFVWEWTCVACGKVLEERTGTCPDCGNPLQRKITKRPV
jgi:UPF0271 protein